MLEQRHFALKMREFNLRALAYGGKYEKYGDKMDQAFMERDINSFQTLNGLFYATGLIDSALKKIEEGNQNSFEDIIFGLQHNDQHHSQVDKSNMLLPPSLINVDLYNNGLSCLQEIMRKYDMAYELELILPSTYQCDKKDNSTTKEDVNALSKLVILGGGCRST